MKFRNTVALVLALLAAPSFAQNTLTAIRGYGSGKFFDVGDYSNTALRVSIVSGAGAGATFGSAMPSTGSALGVSDGTNLVAPRATDADTGAGEAFVLLNNLVRRASGGPVELIGQGTMATSIPVVLSSDQTSIPVAASAVSSANNDGASLGLTTSSATVLASYSTRKFAAVCSLPTNTALVYLKFGATATSSDFVLSPGACWNAPSGSVYSGVIDGVAASGTQTVTYVEW